MLTKTKAFIKKAWKSILSATIVAPVAFAAGVATNPTQRVIINPNISDPYKIQIQFKEKDNNGVEFNDAIYFSGEEFEALTQKELDTKKKQRFDNWKQLIEDAKNAPPLDATILP